MRSYSSSVLIAFFAGLLAQTVILSLFYGPELSGTYIGSALIWLAINILGFSALCNLIFIQLPSSYIKNAATKTSLLLFAVLLSLYWLIITGLLIQLLAHNTFNKTLPFYISALTNGFIYGLIFRIIWQPAEGIQ